MMIGNLIQLAGALLALLAATASSSGQQFRLIASQTANESCPVEFGLMKAADAARPDKDTAQREFIQLKQTLNAQWMEQEKKQLLRDLQSAINNANLTFDVTATPLNLTQPRGARPRRCPPGYDISMDNSGDRLPATLLNATCSAGCRPVRREVQIFQLLCNAAGGKVYRSDFVGIVVDCQSDR